MVTINLPFTLDDVITLLIQVIAIIIAFTVHEYAHGFAAYKLGDSTAKTDGRLSLNPVRHVDIIGLICLLWLHIGWAKPVRLNTSSLSNPKQDMAITAFAGPLSNFLLALISLLIFYPILSKVGISNNVMGYTLSFLIVLSQINLQLGIFNLIPIPPLDGSKFFGAVLPENLYFKFISLDKIGFVVLLLLIYTGASSDIIVTVVNYAWNGLLFIVDKAYFFL